MGGSASYNENGHFEEKIYCCISWIYFYVYVSIDRLCHVKKGIGWTSVIRIAKRKLDILHYASELKDLKAMPGNRLELLKGNLKGCYRIQINDQWRVVLK